MRAVSAIGQRSAPPFGRLTVRNGNLKAASSLWRKSLCKNVKVVFG
nr:MAG TPA: hypothetical protein [Caudoviricetes sp.]